MTDSKLPIIGVTVGDPAGVGPEIVLKSMLDEEIFRLSRPVIIGEVDFLKKIAADLNLPVQVEKAASPGSAGVRAGVACVIDVPGDRRLDIEMGKVQAEAGAAGYRYIKKSIELGLAGEIDAVATAPINKPAVHAAGIPFIGHTEMYGDMTNTKNPLTLFVTGPLRVFFLTRHVSLRQAIDQISQELILDTLGRIFEDLRGLGFENPLVAVAGLNPHAGDQGLFGTEEIEIIAPAVKKAQDAGMRVVGPIPADSVFSRAYRGAYDAVLSLYHDQGHVATKTLDPEHTISVTTGLPFIRTSVDHGTAFDIAGKGLASAVSMVESIKVAADFSRRVRKAKD
jgi:4-hydroxythreonine-4-phosphate dehydrogenase